MRAHSVLRPMRLVGVAAAVAALVMGLPHSDAPAGTHEATAIYFLTPDRGAPAKASRVLPRPSADAALQALLAGPTAEEAQRGLSSAIPETTRLLSLTLARGTAVVDLSGLPDARGVDRVRVITQIARTLIGHDGIERVKLRHHGEPWGLWLMDGGVADVAYGLDKLRGFYLICSARPGTEAIPSDCFTASR